MNERHEFLDNTIGYFDEELKAYWLTMFLAIGFPFILVAGSILQFLLYRLYNRKFHPFKEMAKLKIKGNITKSSVSTTYILNNFQLSVKPEEQQSIRLESVKRRT